MKDKQCNGTRKRRTRLQRRRKRNVKEPQEQQTHQLHFLSCFTCFHHPHVVLFFLTSSFSSAFRQFDLPTDTPVSFRSVKMLIHSSLPSFELLFFIQAVFDRNPISLFQALPCIHPPPAAAAAIIAALPPTTPQHNVKTQTRQAHPPRSVPSPISSP